MRLIKMVIIITILILALAAACSTPPDINRTRMAATDRAETTDEPATFATNTAPPQVGEVTPTPPVTPTSFVFPAAIQPTPVCSGAPRPRLIIHERGRVTDEDEDDLRLRNGPGTSNNILTNLKVHNVFLVLEGPVCSEQYLWWRVRYRTYEGWIAEGEEDYYYVEPYLPG